MNKIAILGGTFNPPHFAHIEMAEIALKKFKLSNIIFIPVFIPPHKTLKQINSIHRLNMIKLLCESNNKFSFSDFEIKNKKISYSINTINYILNKNKKSELYLIIGADNFEIFHTWKNYTDIFKKNKIIVFQRNNLKLNNKYLNPDELNNFYFIKNFNYNISSTQIRNNKNKYLNKYVPKKIQEYISENKLY